MAVNQTTIPARQIDLTGPATCSTTDRWGYWIEWPARHEGVGIRCYSSDAPASPIDIAVLGLCVFAAAALILTGIIKERRT